VLIQADALHTQQPVFNSPRSRGPTSYFRRKPTRRRCTARSAASSMELERSLSRQRITRSATAARSLGDCERKRPQSPSARPGAATGPKRHHRSVPAAVMRCHRLGCSSARLRWRHGIRTVQEQQQRLAVVSGELLQLIEEPPLTCGAEPPIAPTGSLQGQTTTLTIIAGCHGRRRPEVSGAATPRQQI
jgi:hypothetical protein